MMAYTDKMRRAQLAELITDVREILDCALDARLSRKGVVQYVMDACNLIDGDGDEEDEENGDEKSGESNGQTS